MIHIRKITVKDASKFLQLQETLDVETEFMLFEPGERRTLVKNIKGFIGNLVKLDTSAIFIAESSSQLIGFILASGYKTKRNRHVANIVIGILQEFTGRGIGRLLFRTLEDWACKSGIKRLQLSVMSHNHRAIKLYKKVGFVEEGVRQKSVCVNGRYVDEFMMAKLLSHSE